MLLTLDSHHTEAAATEVNCGAHCLSLHESMQQPNYKHMIEPTT